MNDTSGNQGPARWRFKLWGNLRYRAGYMRRPGLSTGIGDFIRLGRMEATTNIER